MNHFDRKFLAIIIAPLPPIFFFLTGWWTSLMFFNNNRVFIFALLGLIIGIVLDILYLAVWVKGAFRMGKLLWLLVYSFYSIGFFGFFMGVPVFNLFLGIPLGIFIVRQAKALKYTRIKTKNRIETASRISTIYMIFICFSSAAIALFDPYTAGNLKGMLNLHFEPTKAMILYLILAGGTALTALQYVITKLSARLTLGKF